MFVFGAIALRDGGKPGERSLGCGSHMGEWGGRPAAGNSWGVLGRRNGTEVSSEWGCLYPCGCPILGQLTPLTP